MRSMRLLLAILVCLLFTLNTGCSQQGEPLPEDILSKLDPEEITACRISWIYPDGYHLGEERDPERVQAVYEALLHMKMRPVEHRAYMGAGSLYWFSFEQDGEDIFLFNFMDGKDEDTYISVELDYSAVIVNERQLEEEYGWHTILYDIMGSAEIIRD